MDATLTATTATPTKTRTILFLTPKSSNMPQLNLDEEYTKVRNALKSNSCAKKHCLKRRTKVTFKTWQKAMIKIQPHIVHFAGHGLGKRGVVIINENGQPTSVSSASLELLLCNPNSNVDCLIVNACFSYDQAKPLSNKIAWVIGITEEAGDHAAIDFAEGFYLGLCAGYDIDGAFREGFTRSVGPHADTVEDAPSVLKPVLFRHGRLQDINELFQSGKILQSTSYPLALQSSTLQPAPDDPNLQNAEDVRTQLIRDRSQQTERHLVTYCNEPAILTLNNSAVKIGYSHQMWFVKRHERAVSENALKVSSAQDYDADQALRIDDFREAAIYYRVQQGAKRPYAGSCVRLADWDGHHAFTLAKALYTDQFATNQKEIVDVNIGQIVKQLGMDIPQAYVNTSLRQLNTLSNATLCPLRSSLLANTIGIASTVVTRDGYLFIQNRPERQHFQSGYNGCSISGVLNWEDALLHDFTGEMKRQLLSLVESRRLLSGVQPVKVLLLAFARELERAGKPQFFFHTWVGDFSSTQMETAAVAGRWLRLFDCDVRTDLHSARTQAVERIRLMLHQDKLITSEGTEDLALSEEARASLYYLLNFLQVAGPTAFPLA